MNRFMIECCERFAFKCILKYKMTESETEKKTANTIENAKD